MIQIGDIFGQWTILAVAPRKRNGRCLCRCSCSRESMVSPYDLTSGKSVRCRTCANSLPMKKNRGRPYAKVRHRNRFLGIVANAIARCTNPEHRRYKDWGGRGIKIHQPWIDDHAAFVEYLTTLEGSGNSKLVIDRIENDGHYEPGNLRFVTRSESQLNRRVESEHAYYMNHGLAKVFKNLHDKGLSFGKIGNLYCAQQSTIRNCVRELEDAA